MSTADVPFACSLRALCFTRLPGTVTVVDSRVTVVVSLVGRVTCVEGYPFLLFVHSENLEASQPQAKDGGPQAHDPLRVETSRTSERFV